MVRKRILKKTRLKLTNLSDGTNGIAVELTRYKDSDYFNRLVVTCLDCNSKFEVYYSNTKSNMLELNGVLMSKDTIKRILLPLLSIKVKNSYIKRLEK